MKREGLTKRNKEFALGAVCVVGSISNTNSLHIFRPQIIRSTSLVATSCWVAGRKNKTQNLTC